MFYYFEPSSLTHLLNNEEHLSQAEERAYFSVHVDTFSAKRVENVRQIGFIAKVDGDGQFDFDFMDTMIQYRQAQSEVFLQVPYDFSMSPRDTLVFASSIEAHVLLMPPAAQAESSEWVKWIDKVDAYSEAMLAFESYGKELLPVTSYVQYMAMRVMGYQPPGLTDDTMMHHFYEHGMNEEAMEQIKANLEKRLSKVYEGLGGFEGFVHGTLSGLYERMDERSQDMAKTLAQQIEDVEESGIGEGIKAMITALEIDSNGFIQLVIDMANDARRSNLSILSTLASQLSEQGIYQIPAMFLESASLTDEELRKHASVTHDFLTKLINA